MAIVKRTFSIPDDVSAMLDAAIPNQRRSRFITRTISEALQKRNCEKLIGALDNIAPWEPTDEPVVDTIRKIRQAQARGIDAKPRHND